MLRLKPPFSFPFLLPKNINALTGSSFDLGPCTLHCTVYFIIFFVRPYVVKFKWHTEEEFIGTLLLKRELEKEKEEEHFDKRSCCSGSGSGLKAI